MAATLRVAPVRIEWAEALGEGDGVFATQFGFGVEPGWAAFPDMSRVMLAYANSGQPAEWGPHLYLLDGVLVGNGGWKGPPVDGVAEIGYAVAPARQGQGIATAAVSHFLAQGRAAGLRLVVAHTLPAESASTAVLARCGFRLTGTDDDADDGPVWRWEFALAPSAS